MAKLKLNPDPTFKSKVGIHVPGRGETLVEFTFKYRDREEAKAFIEESKELSDVESVQAVAQGWELEEAFDDTNIGALCMKYPSAPFRILQAYFNELAGAREKN